MPAKGSIVGVVAVVACFALPSWAAASAATVAAPAACHFEVHKGPDRDPVVEDDVSCFTVAIRHDVWTAQIVVG